MIIEVTQEQRAALLNAWLDRVAHSYPAETSRFLLGTGDPFANPVGAELRNTLGTIIEGFSEDWPLDDLEPVLDRFIRIRAVQEFSPGDSVAFILDLKGLVREHVSGATSEAALMAVDSWVDRLLLKVFSVYVRCRDEMHFIQVKAIRAQSLTVIERLNAWRTRKYEVEEDLDSEPEEAH